MQPAEFELSLARLDDTGEVWKHLVAFARERGVRRIGYHHLPPHGAPDAHLLRVENEGFGDALLKQYLAARASGIAVIANYALSKPEPVYMDEIESLVELTPRERAHIAAYRAAGVKSGLCLQVFGPNGRNGLMALELDDGLHRLEPEALATLRWAAQAMHLRYCGLLLSTLGKLPTLSIREAEVLTWVARGKSNTAIAGILGISSHTVDAHLRRIYVKLGVFDRISAALRGLGFGLIDPGS